MSEKEKVFLKMFDEHGTNSIMNTNGIITSKLLYKLEEHADHEEWYDENILHAQIGEVVAEKIAGHGDHHVEMEGVLKVSGRFFRISYDGVGKDLDEYVNFEMEEVFPRKVVETVYESRN